MTHRCPSSRPDFFLAVAAGTLGRMAPLNRRALHFATESAGAYDAALVLIPADAAVPSADCEWRHAFLDSELPLLVLTGVHEGACLHLVVNLFDRITRAAVGKALGMGFLDLLIAAPHGGASQRVVKLHAAEHLQALALLTKFHRAEWDDWNSWWTRMLLAAGEVPHHVRKLDTRVAACERHCVVLLNADPGVHMSAIDLALAKAVREGG